MPEKIRVEGLEVVRLAKRIPPSSDPAQTENDDSESLEDQLRAAREQVHKLQKLNQSLARSAQRSEQYLQRQESILSLLHEFSSDVILRIGRDGKIRFVSQSGLVLFGTERSYLEGRTFTELLPAEERSSMRGYFQEVLRSEKVEFSRLKLGVNKQYHELDCYFRSVPHPQTQTPELLVLARLVTTPAVKEEALGELGARLAHELSQPLTAIGTTSRVCVRRLRDLLGPEHEITIATQQMAEQSERANELIRRLRQLSTGGVPYRSPVDMNQLVEETSRSLAAPIRHAQTPVVLDLTPDLPLIQADRIQIEQVLLNLIRNALEAMNEVPVDQRQLTLRTRKSDTEVEVSIADNGPGISLSMVEKLFQPYHTTKPHGMGLGLALCRSILQAHQGRLWVKGNKPRGAIFHFALPTNT